MFWSRFRLRMFVSALICLLPLIKTNPVYQPGPNMVTVEASEGSDAILPCSITTKENFTSGLFDWKKDNRVEVFLYDAGDHYNNGRAGQNELFKGRVSHFPDQLKFGNVSIKIFNTKVEDSGIYKCILPRLKPNEEKFFNLVVHGLPLHDRTGEINGTAAKPIVGIYNVTKDGVVLKCVVVGAISKPTVEWQDSDGNQLPAEEPQVSTRGDRYDVSVQTTVSKTKTNLFSCVATQKNIRHVISDEIYVPDKLFESFSPDVGLQIGLGFSGVLNVALAVVVCLLYIRQRHPTDSSDSSQRQSLKSED